jgi:AcrR family transcriptional regulator
VSPKVADPAIRIALIENAARITAEEGRDALTLRRLAADVGTSTMAIYTHFGGMDELRNAVRAEGFARLGTHLTTVDETGDTVADIVALGLAYYANAMANPNLYRAMFLDCDDRTEMVGYETFEVLIRAVERCQAAGRITPDRPAIAVAQQFWACQHGAITLHLAHLLTAEEALACNADNLRNILLASGNSPASITRSINRALSR